MMEKQEAFNFVNWIQLPEVYVPQYKHLEETKRPNSTTVWVVTSSAEFWEVLEHINRLMQEAKLGYPDTLWFRGHSKSSYVLLPSLIRSYFSKKQQCSLPQYQRRFLESFLARSRGTSELIDTGVVRRDNEQIEYIADMQHYGVPTNLLDWSEDISVPLYFATADHSGGYATIYVLHPYFYNFVRHEIIKLFPYNHHDSEGNLNFATTDTTIGGLIPNFSAHFNLTAPQFNNYVTGPYHWESLTNPKMWRIRFPLDDGAVNLESAPLLPLAVQIPRNNPRNRRQSGTFLAFNLCEFPQENDRKDVDGVYHGFRHLDLEEVQKFYLCSEELQRRIAGKSRHPAYAAMRNRHPFLYKIQLCSTVVPDLQRVATMLGKRWDTVYPELYNIGKQIESDILVL